MLSYIGAYTVKVFVYRFVGVTQNEYSQAVQIFISDSVGLNTLFLPMLGAV